MYHNSFGSSSTANNHQRKDFVQQRMESVLENETTDLSELYATASISNVTSADKR